MGGKGNAHLYQTTILNFCLRVAEIRINAIAVHGLLRKVMDIGVILLSPENAGGARRGTVKPGVRRSWGP